MSFFFFPRSRGIKIVCLACTLLWLRTAAQDNNIVVHGTVRSDTASLQGVTVFLKTSGGKATATDQQGHYQIKVPANGTLVFSFVGFKKQEIDIKGDNVINVTLKSEHNTMDEVAVVAYGTQKRSSMVSAITTVNPKELKGPTSNLTTMLAGTVAGVIAFQRSGEPGADNANFFIRGITTFGTGNVNPLILIDGMESSVTDMARLQPDDIAGFSILKDATAASLYGARGANGVILVTTKTGEAGKTKFGFRGENSLSSNTRSFRFADNITYMNLANEAVTTRAPSLPTPYSQEKIDNTAAHADPYLYPSNNWIKQLIKDYTDNQRFDLNITGGSKNAHYYVSGTYNIDNGVLKVDKRNNFNSNIRLRNYEIRSNVTLDFTPTTQAIIRTSGQFDDYNGPIGGGGHIFHNALMANPVMFPAVYPASYAPNLLHPLFGNAILSGTSLYDNPYADMVSGYGQFQNSTLIAQLELKQDLRFLIPGLTARLMTYTNRYSHYDVSRGYHPFYYAYSVVPNTKTGQLAPLNSNGTEYLGYSEGAKNVTSTNYLEIAANYNHDLGNRQTVSGMLIGTLYGRQEGNSGSLAGSLAHRNEGVSGRFTYGYDNRYLAEFNFGYNGSERFAQNHRFGFFPSFGVAYNISNEAFFEPLTKVLSRLKLRATYGLVGNDQIGDANQRFFYLSDINLNDAGKTQYFGTNFGFSQPGITVNRYPNADVTWEKSYKTNIGFEAQLFHLLNVDVNFYTERRKNILMERSTIPNTMGLSNTPLANTGEASGKGMEAQVNLQKTLSKAFWVAMRGTFTYATSKMLVNEEPNYPEAYRSHVGHPLSQQWGLIAERLFVDDKEVANSPVQNFGEVRGGDIKYRDVNKDGQIDGAGDQVPIGLPTTPEITYGFGFTLGWKNFELSTFWEGNARTSFFINANDIQPFALNTSTGQQNGLLKVIADDHWSEARQNLYAFWPRLSSQVITNNQWTSTWWMHDGAFVRLKSVELAYNFNSAFLHRYRISNARLYFNGLNLLAISRFKLWDPEMGGEGLGYPVQRVYNTGLLLSF
ncbi:TonB-dependent receptor [Flavitalea sp. BT771]|uniref:SusC/RagA family TonB-linked outer membrane protein n=1 Tax=Flavitalea sp. BT771 TaxID=3063329 RepID=UPI0026E490E3|nr:TonB-dependent receptor [Flavitalea sp. BT771]MDO6435686.1 TonB-dependent receptor [Flavitalea sp. BT771]MDV6224587.1 TonB-dependent receptor [Flavitalea sp. BT771]